MILIDNIKFLTIKEAVELLGISRPTLNNALNAGKLVGKKVAGRWLIRESDLIKYVSREE